MCQSDNSIPQAPANPNTPQSPCHRRGFYFFNNTRHAQKRIQYLALLQLDQLVCPPSIALQSSTEYPNAAKPNLIYLHLYDCIYCLNASTRYFVPDRHHESHWLALISPQSDAILLGFD
jgi:hypothetical protein